MSLKQDTLQAIAAVTIVVRGSTSFALLANVAILAQGASSFAFVFLAN